MSVPRVPATDVATVIMPYPLPILTMEWRTYKQRVHAREVTEARTPKHSAPYVRGAREGTDPRLRFPLSPGTKQSRPGA
jgi:hypothetical protein